MVPVHLFMSCFITDVPIQAANYYGDEVAPPDKLSQLLTTIHSMRNLTFKSSFFFIELDEGFNQGANLVSSGVRTWFPHHQQFRSKRLYTFESWRLALNEIEDEGWVLLMNNHDHPFIHQNTLEWERFLDELDSSPANFAHVSHWPEVLGWRRMTLNKSFSRGVRLGFYDTETIGTVLVRSSYLKSLFQRDFTGGLPFVRPDNPFGPNLEFERQFIPVPRVEFFRHLDGYGHVGIDLPMASALRNEVICGTDSWAIRPWLYTADCLSDPKDLVAVPDFYTVNHKRSETTMNQLVGLLYLATAHRVRFKIFANLVKDVPGRPLRKFGAIIRILAFNNFWRSLRKPFEFKNLIKFLKGQG
jgi:hypothetical protein